MISATQFLALYPQFSSVELHLIQYQLDFAANNYCSGWTEPKKTDGAMLIAAHNLSMSWFQQADVASSAAGIASGSGSKSPSGTENDWSLTTYGRQYIALRDTIYVPPLIVL